MAVLVSGPPCVIHEDEHLLVVNKPPGLNTHSPSPYAGEGLYEWLRNREPRWSTLAIIHRLDKATSGLLVFAKTRLANQSLTAQFTARTVRKRYALLTAAPPGQARFTVRSGIVRAGEKYEANPAGEPAETRFEAAGQERGYARFFAEPLTGRTHQIRVHAELQGMPVLGDTLYGGAPFARVCLHAEELEFRHPQTGEPAAFRAAPDFFEHPGLALRRLMIEPELTDAFRLLHRGSDGAPYFLERWGDYLLALSEGPPGGEVETPSARGFYWKRLHRDVARTSQKEAAPQLIRGQPAPAHFGVRENGVKFEISFEQGYSTGLFLDQRDNRRRLLVNYAGPGFALFEGGLAGRTVLNTFAYTCGFSVCAALAGARTTSVDLSRKYLEWGRRNFLLNGLDPGGHDFIYGDAFEWAQRLQKKRRVFDLVILDPPTFSRGKTGIFQAEKDLEALADALLPLLAASGVLLASTNASKLAPEVFAARVQAAVEKRGRRILAMQYAPQPLDFPISKAEPAYLKTAWMRVS